VSGPITVAVCTLDRPATLARTLASLADQRVPAPVLVVDNSAAKSARKTWEDFAARATGPTDYAHVTEPGLSAARNAALRAATTRFVAYLDDDVTLPATWFPALAASLEDPRVVAVGGRIRLAWEGGRPSWFRREHETLYSGLDLGDQARDFLIPWETPFGANFAVDRALALERGGFNAALGRNGRSLLGGEDVDLILRVADGGVVRYVPDAWVDHHISAERTSRRWLLRRYLAQGITEALLPPGDPRAAPPPDRHDPPRHDLGLLPYRVARQIGRYRARFG